MDTAPCVAQQEAATGRTALTPGLSLHRTQGASLDTALHSAGSGKHSRTTALHAGQGGLTHGFQMVSFMVWETEIQ